MRSRIHNTGIPETFSFQGGVSEAWLSQQLTWSQSAGSGYPRPRDGEYYKFIFLCFIYCGAVGPQQD